MSEILKYKKALNFRANPRYLTRDFIVPLYTGTEPDIVPETNVDPGVVVDPSRILPKNFTDDMPFVTDENNTEQLELTDGGSVERQGYSFAGLVKETKNKLTNESNPQKKFQLKKRLNFLEDLQKKSKNIQGSKSIENLVSKKDKLGRPFFSDYLEKINALEDLQNNKYLNPKTNKTFTPQEWLKASPSYRSKFRDPETFREKKKEYQKEYMRERKLEDPEFAEKQKTIRKEAYYSAERKNKKGKKGERVLTEQRNKLLGYLSKAAENNPNYKKITKEGQLVGVTDKLNGINYYESGYKGKLGKNSKLITEHPDYNDVNNLAKLADRFKRELPNKAIASYFSAYERVPTMSEMYNFLQSDPRFVEKMSPKFFQTNALHLHHQVSVTESPSQKIQLLLQDRNDQAGKKLIEFQKGNITEEQLNKDLKKLNTKYYVDGKPLGAIETSPDIQLRTAKGQTTKLFNQRLQENPELVEQMTRRLGINKNQMIANIGCPTLVSKSIGGRVNFSNGSNCYMKGLEKIQSGELGNAERRIASEFLKEAGADTKLISSLAKGGKNAIRLLQDFTVGLGPGGALLTAGISVPFALAEAAEGASTQRMIGAATDIIPGLGPIIGTTRESELRKKVGPELEPYLKNEQNELRYNEIESEIQRLEKNIEDNLLSGEVQPFGYQQEKINKLKEEEKQLEKDLISYKENPNVIKKINDFAKKEQLRLEIADLKKFGQPIDSITVQEKDPKTEKEIQEKQKNLETLEKDVFSKDEPYEETPEQRQTIEEMGAREGAAEGGYIDYIREYNRYASGGRIHLGKGGGGPKLSRRGFLGFLAGAAASPFVVKAMKGKKLLSGAKVATKVLPKVAGMPDWFNPLVTRIMNEGIDISPKAERVEDIVKVKKLEFPMPEEGTTKFRKSGSGFEKKNIETITMTEYPDGTIEIEADVFGSSFDAPYTLTYRPPKLDINVQTGEPIKSPGDFSVIEQRPRPDYSDPGNFEIDYESMSVEDAISDLEKLEKIGTGKRIHPKRVEQRTGARKFVEENPSEDIVNRYGDGEIEYDRMKDEGLFDETE